MAESMVKSDSSIIVAVELLMFAELGALSSEVDVYKRNGAP